MYKKLSIMTALIVLAGCGDKTEGDGSRESVAAGDQSRSRNVLDFFKAPIVSMGSPAIKGAENGVENAKIDMEFNWSKEPGATEYIFGIGETKGEGGVDTNFEIKYRGPDTSLGLDDLEVGKIYTHFLRTRYGNFTVETSRGTFVSIPSPSINIGEFSDIGLRVKLANTYEGFNYYVDDQKMTEKEMKDGRFIESREFLNDIRTISWYAEKDGVVTEERIKIINIPDENYKEKYREFKELESRVRKGYGIDEENLETVSYVVFAQVRKLEEVLSRLIKWDVIPEVDDLTMNRVEEIRGDRDEVIKKACLLKESWEEKKKKNEKDKKKRDFLNALNRFVKNRDRIRHTIYRWPGAEDALVGMGFSAGDVDSSITHFDFFDKVTSKLEDVWKALASTSSKKREKQKDIITAFFREMKDPENDIVKGMDAILDDEDESEDVKEAVREIKGDMEDVLSEAISIEVESSNKAEDTTSLKDDVDSDYEDEAPKKDTSDTKSLVSVSTQAESGVEAFNSLCERLGREEFEVVEFKESSFKNYANEEALYKGIREKLIDAGKKIGKVKKNKEMEIYKIITKVSVGLANDITRTTNMKEEAGRSMVDDRVKSLASKIGFISESHLEYIRKEKSKPNTGEILKVFKELFAECDIDSPSILESMQDIEAVVDANITLEIFAEQVKKAFSSEARVVTEALKGGHKSDEQKKEYVRSVKALAKKTKSELFILFDKTSTLDKEEKERYEELKEALRKLAPNKSHSKDYTKTLNNLASFMDKLYKILGEENPLQTILDKQLEASSPTKV